MAKIPRPSKHDIHNEARALELLTRLTDAVNRLENITAGPGITINRGAGGMSISAKGAKVGGRAAPGTATAGAINDTLTLARLQGTRDTDDWERGGDDPPRSVKVYLLTDLKYDEATLQFTMRARACTFDTAGCLYQIDAEDSDATLVFTAVLCEEEPS